MTTSRSMFVRVAAFAAIVIAASGRSDYKITDPTTDKTSYTEKYDRKDGISFTDAATGG